jgi:hypothetical protein
MVTGDMATRRREAQIKQRLFGNTPNLRLRGTTFDVQHLDQFIAFDHVNKSGILTRGETPIVNERKTPDHFHTPMNNNYQT